MITNQVKALCAIIKDKDLREYAGKSFIDLVIAVVSADPLATVNAAKDFAEIIFHAPTLLFWGKMRQYLFGTFHDYEEQVAMAEKFNEDNEGYVEFVKQQMQLVDAVDDEKKIPYVAALTRSHLVTDLTRELHERLVKFILLCTPTELNFLKDCPYDFRDQNSAMISLLYQYGLFTQQEEHGNIWYVLSDFAKALKQYSLNYNDGIHGTRYGSYEALSPLELTEPVAWKEMMGSF